MKNESLEKSIKKLSNDFRNIKWKYLKVPAGSPQEKTQLWPGSSDENVIICVAKGNDAVEAFHRQDFFFFNFAYQGDYGAISYKYDNRITVHEGECYIGQPYAGYAIEGQSEDEIIIGVLIQTNAFLKTYLSALSADAKIFNFFIEPQNNEFSDEFINLKFDDVFSVRTLLEIMVIEYANKSTDTQEILKPLTIALMMHVARQYRKTLPELKSSNITDKIVHYISEHLEIVSLKTIAQHFSYHPNYISSLIHKELGKSFSQLLLEQRMSRALSFLKGTNLSVEEIAYMLGYSNSSNFFKAFRNYYGMSPREYINNTSNNN